MEKFPITKNGFEKLKEEIKHLKYSERPEITKAIAVARDFGDLSENADQPFTDKNKNATLMCNGEIYNSKQLT